MSQTNKPRVTLHDKTFELSIPYEELNVAIQKVADQINADYKDADKPLFRKAVQGTSDGCSAYAEFCRKSKFGQALARRINPRNYFFLKGAENLLLKG